MKSKKQIIVILIAVLLTGSLIGYFIGNNRLPENPNPQIDKSTHQQITTSPHQIWTCSMHPQIRQNEPGDCPICGMDLIPLQDEQDSEIDPLAISMSPTAMQLANIQTAVVGSMEPVRQVRLNGKIQEDERLVFSQSSHVPGRIEELMVNFTGEYIKKGQVIASVYSPALVTAQEELFEAQKIKDTQPQLFNAVKEKLTNWKLTDQQIEQILQSGTAKETLTIQADGSGYVIKKMVNPGDYVSRGQTIYQIADLSRVWVLFDVYESDLPWIKKGDKVEFTVASLPGETFTGKLSFLDPVIDPKTRVAKARVAIDNPGLKFKPEMFVSGTVRAQLPKKSNAVVIPKTAVMWTGERSVVYVKSATDQGVNFKMREVMLGPSLGESYVIESGLKDGEEIAVNGTFSIDAAAQLAGKPSMMNPEGGPAITGHNHGGMEMPASNESPHSEKTNSKEVFIPGEPLPEPGKTNPEFKAQLTNVYNTYLDMKNAFVASDAKKVSIEAKVVKAALKSVDMGLLKGDGHTMWMEQLETLNNTINAISSSDNLEQQRKDFARFNLVFYKSLKMFGLDNETAYYQYCPMASGSKGAYWLSETEEIRNPYFGEDMMECGETRETLK